MKRTVTQLLGLSLAFSLLVLSCKTEPPGPWEAFVNCATNACVTEAVAVKDAFLKDPKAMFAKFEASGQKGEDHFIGWLYILRDSVLLNSAHSPTEERIAMQQAIVDAARPFETDPAYGDLAKSVTGEVEMLAIASELEDNIFEYAPLTGTYAYELPNDGGNGTLKISRIDADTILFDLEIVGGPPAHNQGMIQLRATQVSPGVYESVDVENGLDCKLQLLFDKEAVEIKTLKGGSAECGFGNGIVADNVYRMTSYDDPFLSGADAAMAKNLQGTWVSTTDNKSEISIENGMYTERYDGEQMSSLPYQVFPKCPALCNPVAETPCIAVMGQDDVCYAVVKADGQSLELSMIGGTGNTLVFKKK